MFQFVASPADKLLAAARAISSVGFTESLAFRATWPLTRTWPAIIERLAFSRLSKFPINHFLI